MVLPFGEHTSALSLAGSAPLSKAYFADPRTVCSARSLASSRVRPARTPPSISASMNMYTKAGPQPDTAQPASILLSGTVSSLPAGANILSTASMSSFFANAPAEQRMTPSPLAQGVLGIMRTTGTLPRAASIAEVLMPAAMLTTTNRSVLFASGSFMV